MDTIKRYDVGIVGWWSNLNYGGTITYYALNKALQDLGKSVLMVRRSCPEGYEPSEDTVPMRFAKKHYNISQRYTYQGLKDINQYCNAFIAGSDQLWNPHLMPWSGPEFFLSFAADDKIKIAYSTSFGNIEHCNPDFIKDYGPLLRRFDHISVREDYAVDICKSDFDIDGVQICDPVFLCDVKSYKKIARVSKQRYPKKYVLNFLLDPDNDKVAAAQYIRKQLGINEYVNYTDLQNVEQHVSDFGGEHVYAEHEIEDILKAYRDAEFVVTDSFHGTCLAIIFNKPFISLANRKRGEKRFISVLNWLQLKHRLVFDYNEIYTNKALLEPVDYAPVNKIISKGRDDGLAWLDNALKTKMPSRVIKSAPMAQAPATPVKPEIAALHSNPDFIKIRLLATLLRDYGIKHVVLSPGGRDVPLVRMFEYNDDQFVLHRVTDERSAAYFGLGIAAQLQQPVACVCTSGTAASNYLPAVTEAYYTGVPLIVITADRKEIYLNHGEDQTIPQKNIYNGVVKKAVSVPEASGYHAEYQTRRDISDCILEATHNGFGPVHINISIDNIMVGARVAREHWKLLPQINPHLLRVSPSDGEAQMMKWVDTLKKSKKILVVYGQNPPANEKQLRNIERFASKYNCVFVTDFLSNLDSKYTLMPYNMLQAISQQDFNEKLSPDILISVGGKRLMNDPLMYKIRGGLKSIRHWGVTPDGKVKDLYFRESSVLEMSQDYFFEWFADHADSCANDCAYLNAWQEHTSSYAAPIIDKFNAHYIQSKFIPSVPANSLLHLGVGQSFYDSRRYAMDKTVEVFCNMGTNGIDGCTSTFMGQCAVVKDKLCFLLVGDLSFFYDMNSIWNKQLDKNIRILMVNNNGTGLLRGHNLKAIASIHNTEAKGWVESTGFAYMCARSKKEFDEKLAYFISNKSDKALFFEVFCD